MSHSLAVGKQTLAESMERACECGVHGWDGSGRGGGGKWMVVVGGDE